MKRGKPLSIESFHKLQPGDVVWMRYKKSGEKGFRIDHPATVRVIDSPDSIGFDCTDFTLTEYFPPRPPTDQASDEAEGSMTLWHIG